MASQARIAVVGNANIGKTCLLMSYRPTVQDEIPSIFKPIHIEKKMFINGSKRFCNITLCDTGASEQNLSFRKKAYKNTDIILVCFDVLNINSLKSVGTHWMNEINAYAPDTLRMLIGLKSDLRSSQNRSANKHEIPPSVIQSYSSKYDFIDYIETSALQKKNVTQAFEIAVEEFMASGNRHRQTTVFQAEDDLDLDPNDIVGTHQLQWAEHLKSIGPEDNDAFGAFEPAMDTFNAFAQMEDRYEESPELQKPQHANQVNPAMHQTHAYHHNMMAPANNTYRAPPKEAEPPSEPQTIEESLGSLDTELESNLSDIYSTEIAAQEIIRVKTIEENREINVSPPPPSHIASELSEPPAAAHTQRMYDRSAPHANNQIAYINHTQNIPPPPLQAPQARRGSDSSSQLSEVTETTLAFMSRRGIMTPKQGIMSPKTIAQSRLSEITESTVGRTPKMASRPAVIVVEGRKHPKQTQMNHKHVGAPNIQQNNRNHAPQMNRVLSAPQKPQNKQQNAAYNIMSWNGNNTGVPQPLPYNAEIYPPQPQSPHSDVDSKAERELLQRRHKNGKIKQNVIVVERSPPPQQSTAQEKKNLKATHQAIVLRESIERSGTIDYALGRNEQEDKGCSCVLL